MNHERTPDELYARYEALMREEWHGPRGLDGGQNVRALARLVEEAVVEEREACAKLVETGDDGDSMMDAMLRSDLAAEIRARARIRP